MEVYFTFYMCSRSRDILTMENFLALTYLKAVLILGAIDQNERHAK